MKQPPELCASAWCQGGGQHAGTYHPPGALKPGPIHPHRFGTVSWEVGPWPQELHRRRPRAAFWWRKPQGGQGRASCGSCIYAAKNKLLQMACSCGRCGSFDKGLGLLYGGTQHASVDHSFPRSVEPFLWRHGSWHAQQPCLLSEWKRCGHRIRCSLTQAICILAVSADHLGRTGHAWGVPHWSCRGLPCFACHPWGLS